MALTYFQNSNQGYSVLMPFVILTYHGRRANHSNIDAEGSGRTASTGSGGHILRRNKDLIIDTPH
jgi:hypothetical protein